MIPLLRSPLLEKISFISHGFTTRQGGVSTGDFSTLNTVAHRGDLLENVLENQRRIAETLGGNSKNLATLNQVHSNTVLLAEDVLSHPERLQGDALITQKPGIIIGVFTADCVPILLADPCTFMIAAIHAGWKGAVAGIISNTITKMVEQGAHRQNIIAAIGPCIWQKDYEVSPDFYENFFKLPFISSFDDPAYYFQPSPNFQKKDHWLFNLPHFVEDNLRKEGIQNISPSPANTYDDPKRFFSYRRKTHLQEKAFGNSLSAIMIR